jgi:2-iminobutanoate/2-iminopropanoate deaminase
LGEAKPGVSLAAASRISLTLNPGYDRSRAEGKMRASLQSINMTLAAGIGLLASAGAVFAADEPSMYFYNSPAAAAAKVPFSQAVRVGDVVYLSGALGNVPGTRELAAGGIEAETKQTMENIGTVLKANALSFDDVFKCTAMLADMAKWGDFNKVYVTYFKPDRLPARSAFGASGLALGAQVELECWAYAGKK